MRFFGYIVHAKAKENVMKRTLTGFLTASLLLTAAGCSAQQAANEETEQQQETEEATEAEENTNIIYSYSAADAGFTMDHAAMVAPNFYIYAGQKTEEEAKKLIDDLGMMDTVNKWTGNIFVINPLNNDSYTADDAEAFPEILGAKVSNAKVIGIDEGADFVNNEISQECYAVAGIMTVGGEMKEGLEYNVEVPAYLVNPSETAEKYYIRANKAVETEKNVYENPDNPLARVVIADDADLSKAFANAWEKVFDRNYRQYNEHTEWYNSNAVDFTDPYPLITFMDPETLGIRQSSYYFEPFEGEGSYTWFEYVPESVLNAEDGTIPLVVSLHGNGNDPRMQGDSTGWPELAVKEGFIVAVPEWQEKAIVEGTTDTKPNFFDCNGLERDRLIRWIDMLEEKYPQIDASRIYLTGLSAGASASTLYGLLYSDVFAAVGAVSAPGLDRAEVAELAENYEGGEMPWLYFCGDYDFFGMIPVDLSSTNSFELEEGVYLQTVDGNSTIWPYIPAYQKINGLEVQEEYNMEDNPYYGVKGDEQKMIRLGERDALETSFSNENGLIIKLVAINDYAHWNYKPEAEYMWDFFCNYARNTETGELIRR